jgi:hypothetical protein
VISEYVCKRKVNQNPLVANYEALFAVIGTALRIPDLVP